MKKKGFASMVAWFSLLFVLVCPGNAVAQKPTDKDIIGVWKMTSMMYEGENKNMINDSYNQIKVYRANGEYACAEIVKGKNGKYVIMPHEYGTYYLKNGMYSEMGRDPIRYNWVDKNTSRGRWYNRVDEWKKVIGMPEELVQHIVDKCKPLAESPAKMQELMKKYIFGK